MFAGIALGCSGDAPTDPLTVEPLFDLSAHGPKMVVNGAGDPAIDVPAVQDAVDSYGRVELRGNFDFGESGSVLITKAVELMGQLPSLSLRQ